MQIGIAGLGRMGAAIAGRLIEAGHTLSVWNRSPEKAGPLEAAGAALARSPGELAAKVGTVITILTDAAAIETVYDGPSGLLSGKVAGKLFIEMSTVRPQTEIDLAGRVRAKGAGFVECPVGGTVGPARQGKLIGLMGAEEDDAARARPILAQLCRRLEHVGPVGNGALMKLARCSQRARRAASSCRWSSGRLPASSRRAATAGAAAMRRACRSTGRRRPPGSLLGDAYIPRVRSAACAGPAIREGGLGSRAEPATRGSLSAAARSRGASSRGEKRFLARRITLFEH